MNCYGVYQYVIYLLGKPSRLNPGRKSRGFVTAISSPPSLISTSWPLFKYFADDIVFNKAPLGDQENLYLRGLSLNSGAGKPPQKDSKEVILPVDKTKIN